MTGYDEHSVGSPEQHNYVVLKPSRECQFAQYLGSIINVFQSQCLNEMSSMCPAQRLRKDALHVGLMRLAMLASGRG